MTSVDTEPKSKQKSSHRRLSWGVLAALGVLLAGMEIFRACYRWPPLSEWDHTLLQALPVEAFQPARRDVVAALLRKQDEGILPVDSVNQLSQELPPTLMTLAYTKELPFRAVLADLKELATICAEDTQAWRRLLIAYRVEQKVVTPSQSSEALTQRVDAYQEAYDTLQKRQKAFLRRLREKLKKTSEK